MYPIEHNDRYEKLKMFIEEQEKSGLSQAEEEIKPLKL